jgi:putative pyruvate formate lyase activating enzyme
MFRILRRSVVESDGILEHYFGVVEGKKNARYLDNKEKLPDKIKKCKEILKECHLCERRCGVNRSEKKGVCGVKETKISSFFVHMGEEPELIPSFTIFFAGCNLKCVFCQNWDISQNSQAGKVMSKKKVSKLIAKTDARNVNWVGGDPIPNIGFILNVLKISETNIPQVFNSNMYFTLEALDLLEGMVDLYLTDFKYGNSKCGKRLSKVKNYFEVVSRNHELVNKDTDMIIRHLILPGHYECCTVPIIRWIAEHLDVSRTKMNIMAQYHPEHNAWDYEELQDSIDMKHFFRAKDLASEYGIPLSE